ncbi:unnamed protein product [Cylicocyclus nassatus]|uniref:Uncharacterized protein n=1 Tax=Cylicocyclus nassatus TaxID=53992 RepID=A0AA36GVS3_CYLNA|nr:unnamed protein product [Cylicocyclus nassatus]
MYRAAVSPKRKSGGPQTYAKPRPVFPPCLTGRENSFVENIVEDEGAPSDIQMELKFHKVTCTKEANFMLKLLYEEFSLFRCLEHFMNVLRTESCTVTGQPV